MDWYWYVVIGAGVGLALLLWLLLDCNFSWNKNKFRCVIPRKEKITGDVKRPVKMIERTIPATDEQILQIFTGNQNQDELREPEEEILPFPESDSKYRKIQQILQFQFQDDE